MLSVSQGCEEESICSDVSASIFVTGIWLFDNESTAAAGCFCSSAGKDSGFTSVDGSTGAFCSSGVVDALPQSVSKIELDGITGEGVSPIPRFGGVEVLWIYGVSAGWDGIWEA